MLYMLTYDQNVQNRVQAFYPFQKSTNCFLPVRKPEKGLMDSPRFSLKVELSFNLVFVMLIPLIVLYDMTSLIQQMT